MRDSSTTRTIAEIDERIATVRENLRELIEQAAADSGASTEQLISQRIAEQEALLNDLENQRKALSHPSP
jgi:ribosome-binding protein aMBF1 (putative translation factor)